MSLTNKWRALSSGLSRAKQDTGRDLGAAFGAAREGRILKAAGHAVDAAFSSLRTVGAFISAYRA